MTGKRAKLVVTVLLAGMVYLSGWGEQLFAQGNNASKDKEPQKNEVKKNKEHSAMKVSKKSGQREIKVFTAGDKLLEGAGLWDQRSAIKVIATELEGNYEMNLVIKPDFPELLGKIFFSANENFTKFIGISKLLFLS